MAGQPLKPHVIDTSAGGVTTSEVWGMSGRWLLLVTPGVVAEEEEAAVPTSGWGSGSLPMGSVAEEDRSLSDDLELWCSSLGAGRELLL